MKDFQGLFAECCIEARHLGIPISNHIKTVRVNNRLSRAMGRCKRINNYLGEWFEIEINPCMLAEEVDPMETKNTIVHELIHTCPGCMNHGDTFHYYAKIVNRKLGYHVDTYVKTSALVSAGVKVKTRQKETYKYALVCKACGHEYKRKRWSEALENPSRYRCNCGGSLFTKSLIGNKTILTAANSMR